ncbi:DUF397 domain-containing protein [Streptomyces niveus]|uniref:DUF397 domain-containing protein n=1 Tax=Streptomyces niveus TaxID=193462 RepID=UPI003B5940B7
MTATVDALNGTDWFKSSYSDGHGGNCVEGAQLPGGTMAVRDSRTPTAPPSPSPAPPGPPSSALSSAASSSVGRSALRARA